MTLAPASTTQIGLTPRRGTPRLAAPTSEMTPFPEQISPDLIAPTLFILSVKEGPAAAAAPKPASVAAPPVSRSKEAVRPSAMPMAEMQIVAPPKGKLATVFQSTAFPLPATALSDYDALPFRRKFVIGSPDSVLPLAAAAAAAGAESATIPEPAMFPGLEDAASTPARPSLPKLEELAAKPKVQPIRKNEAETAPAPAKQEKPGRQIDAPSLSMGAGESGVFSKIPLFGWLGLGAAIIVGVLFFMMAGKKEAPAESNDVAGSMKDITAGQSMAGGGWVTDYAIGAGQTRARQLTLFRESMSLSNYRVNFNLQVQARAATWVFRAVDMKNYYAMKLELGTGPNGQASLYKFAVINGEEGPRLKIPVPFPVKNDTILRVTEDVRGPQFRVYLQGQMLDTWADTQLKTGGVGFLRERGEQASILSVEILK